MLARRRGFDSLVPAQGLASLHVALDSAAPRQLIGLCAAAEPVLRLLPPASVTYEVEAGGIGDGVRVAAALGIAPERVRCTRAARQVAAAVPSAHAAALLAVFRDVLVRPELAEDDNFFANGGDSIRAIQVVSRAADLGLRFSPLDLFEHKSVAALLGHLARHQGLGGADLDAGADDGQPVALPPIFGWWLERADRREVRDHFTMGMRYELDAALAPDDVRDALLALIGRHDALRLRLCGEPGAWRLGTAPDPADSLQFAAHALAGRHDGSRPVDAIERDLHRGLDLESGPLVNAAHVTFAQGGPALLLLVIHHAAIDGVSWRILEDELRMLLDAGRKPGGHVPAPAAIGFRDWARRLTQRARRIDGAALADAWAAALAQPAGSLPGVDGRPLLESDTAVRSRTVPIEALRLLGDASVYEVLLTAVGWSMAAWMGSQAVVLDVEGHGRLSRDMPENLGRTVGWFTSIAPLRLDFSGCRDVPDGLERVRRATADLRGRDLEWGMLQYMDACPPAHPLRAVPRRQVSFNYLGSFDSAARPEASLTAVPDSLSAEQSPSAPRRYAIDIAAQVTDWKLEVSVKYSPEVHGHAVIERWLDACEDALRRLLGSPSHPSLSADDMLLALGEVEFDTEEA
jgi:non-ribosomal peptide synthase protein (TIGR01720 family)